jgi:hypothetical protein
MRAGRRTIVVSDAHGYPAVIANALEHSGFRPGIDGFVYAGDFVDRGPDEVGCLALIERYATQVLVGNHELSVLVDFPLAEQTAASRGLRQLLLDRVFSADPAEAWRAALCIDGVLVTHAGIASRYERAFIERCDRDPARLAEHLNQMFVGALRRQLQTGGWDRAGILGDDGVLWFRPRPWSSLLPLANVVQVTGHTPPDEKLEPEGFFMVDPCVWMEPDVSTRYRYAVIEDGRVRVEDGRLTGSGVVDGSDGGAHRAPARAARGAGVGADERRAA